MKTISLKGILGMLAIVGMLTVSSCKKNAEMGTESDVTTVTDSVSAASAAAPVTNKTMTDTPTVHKAKTNSADGTNSAL